MSINIGDIDVAKEIVELNYQLHRTQRLLDILANKLLAGSTGITAYNNNRLSPEDIALADREALSFVQTKFPSMGIERKT